MLPNDGTMIGIGVGRRTEDLDDSNGDDSALDRTAPFSRMAGCTLGPDLAALFRVFLVDDDHSVAVFRSPRIPFIKKDLRHAKSCEWNQRGFPAWNQTQGADPFPPLPVLKPNHLPVPLFWIPDDFKDDSCTGLDRFAKALNAPALAFIVLNDEGLSGRIGPVNFDDETFSITTWTSPSSI